MAATRSVPAAAYSGKVTILGRQRPTMGDPGAAYTAHVLANMLIQVDLVQHLEG